jgi:hypothetical protein
MAVPKPTFKLQETMLNCRQLKRGVYIGRSMMPAERCQGACLLNMTDQEQRIRKDTCLGIARPVEQLNNKAEAGTSRQ